MVCAPATRIFSSPRPVDPAAPTSWSTYNPAPIIGESPTRPGIFQAKPLVVVTPDISPLVFNARQLMVPVGGRWAISQAHARVALSADGNIAFKGASRSPFQLL